LRQAWAWAKVRGAPAQDRKGKGRTAMKKMTIQLTSDQQKQIKEATGKDVSEMNLNFGEQGELNESELGLVQGGLNSFSFGASNPANSAR
jgi:hypothetical protein